CGKTYSQGAGSSDGWLFHIDAFGNMVDEWVYGGVGEDEFVDVEVTEDGRVVCGGNEIINGISNAILRLIWLDGVVIWTNTKESFEYSFSISSIDIFEETIAVCGKRLNDLNKFSWRGKFTLTGEEEFDEQSNLTDTYCYNDIIMTAEHTILPGETKVVGAGGFDVTLYMWSPTNTFIGAPTVGGAFDEGLFSGYESMDGSVVCSGYARSFDNGLGQLFVIKFPSVHSGDYLFDFDYSGDCFAVNQPEIHVLESKLALRTFYYDPLGRLIRISEKPNVLLNSAYGLKLMVIEFSDGSIERTKIME
ncbi:MAG: hypothetical protein SGI87_14440, partial [Flavobacteriales bacterium]|nr:hypothetical protein [Flavobacteriales bacterium]